MPAPPDIYQNEVDFTALALRYPDFAKKSLPTYYRMNALAHNP